MSLISRVSLPPSVASVQEIFDDPNSADLFRERLQICLVPPLLTEVDIRRGMKVENVNIRSTQDPNQVEVRFSVDIHGNTYNCTRFVTIKKRSRSGHIN